MDERSLVPRAVVRTGALARAEAAIGDALVASLSPSSGLTKAEREGQDLLKRARKEADEILSAADLRAEDRLAASVSESQLKARQLAASVAEDIRSAVANHLPGVGEAPPEVLSGKAERNGKAAAQAETKGSGKGSP